MLDLYIFPPKFCELFFLALVSQNLRFLLLSQRLRVCLAARMSVYCHFKVVLPCELPHTHTKTRGKRSVQPLSTLEECSGSFQILQLYKPLLIPQKLPPKIHWVGGLGESVKPPPRPDINLVFQISWTVVRIAATVFGGARKLS